MVTWSKVAGFHWDSDNKRKPAKKESVTQLEAEQVFFNQPLMVLDDVKHQQDEARFHALGKTDSARFLHVTFTLRSADTLIHVISARDIRRK